MNKWPLLLAALIGAVFAIGLTFGVQAVASGGTGTTIYGCLKGGKLSQVGTTAPTCTSKQTPIQWNSFPASANGTPQCTGIPHVGIDLSGCDLQGAGFNNTDMSEADLSSANLSDSPFFTSVNLTDANLSNANLSSTTIGNINFTGANLSGVNLTNSGGGPFILTNANLSGANGNGVAWSNISGTPSALPTGFAIVNGYLVGPGANLANDDFLNANLAGLNLAGDNVSGVFWSNTTCPDGTNSNNDGATCVGHLTP